MATKHKLTRVRDVDPGGGKALAVAFHPTEPILAVGCRNGTIYLLSSETGEVLRKCRGHREFVYCMAWHPSGEVLLSSGKDTTMRLWDPDTGDMREDLAGIVRNAGARTMYGTMGHHGSGHTKTPLDVCFSDDGEYLGSGGQDHLVKLWQNGRVERTFNWHGGPVTAVGFRPGTGVLLSASRDGSVRTWDPHTGSMIHKYEGHRDEIEATVWIDDERFASADISGTIVFWSEDSERPETEVREASAVRCLAATPDGALLLAGLESGDLVVRNTETGRKSSNQKLDTYEAHDMAIRSLDVDPSGKLVATGSNDGRVRIWSLG